MKINSVQRTPDFLAAPRWRRTPRPRRPVAPRMIPLLSPVMRHSATRDAYVLRLVGGRFGPVLVPRTEVPLSLEAPQPVAPPDRRPR